MPRGSTSRIPSGAATAALALCSAGAWADVLPRFPAGAVWRQDISVAAPHVDSVTMIDTLQGLGGFGNGRFQIDFSIRVVRAAPGAPVVPITVIAGGGPDDQYYTPDCDDVGSNVPVPVGATIEGQGGMNCVPGRVAPRSRAASLSITRCARATPSATRLPFRA